jgi:hypothetical protein
MVMQKPVDNAQDCATPLKPRAGERGFALYLSLGFVALMSLLVSSVGDRLNVAVLNDARRQSGQTLLHAADTALQRGWLTLQGLAPGPITLPADAFDANVAADKTLCLGGRVDTPSDYIASARMVEDDTDTRYFIDEDGGDYIIFGCAFENGKARQIMAVWTYSTPDFTLEWLRQF